PYPPLSCRASFPHSSGLAWVHLVWDGFRILDQPFRHSPAPYFQREALLVSGDGIRRDSIRALRQPQSLRWLRGIDSPSISRSPGLGQSSARTLAYRWSIRGFSYRRAFLLPLP